MNKLIVLVGPSGAGKTLISNFLVNNDLDLFKNLIPARDEKIKNIMVTNLRSLKESVTLLNFNKIITSTTRPPRANESHSKDYFFYSREDFQQKIATGDFLEHVENFQNYYGTCFDSIKNSLNIGHSIIILDDEGAKKLKSILPNQTITIYLDIPLHIMEERMNCRNDDFASMSLRLSNLKILEYKALADFTIDASKRIDIVLITLMDILNTSLNK